MTDLPELPEPELLGAEVAGHTADFYGHSDEAMRSYGEACRRAGLEEAARIAEAPTIRAFNDQDSAAAEQLTALMQLYFGEVAAAIRSAAQKPSRA